MSYGWLIAVVVVVFLWGYLFAPGYKFNEFCCWLQDRKRAKK